MSRLSDAVLFENDPDFATVRCPDCGGADVTVQSLFGSTTSEVLFFCQLCHSCFNWVKWQHILPMPAADPNEPTHLPLETT